MSILTAIQRRRVKVALRILRARLGAWKALATALPYDYKLLRAAAEGERQITPLLVFRIADLAAVSIDDLLAGKYPPPGMCPHCGRDTTAPPFSDEETSVE